MTNQERNNEKGLDLELMSSQDRSNLLLTTTDTQVVDQLETMFIYRLKYHADIRLALYAVARQNAQYRRDQAPDEVLPTVNTGLMALSDVLELLKTTCDVKLVNDIEMLTEGRLRKLPDYRVALFEIARLGVAYRAAAQIGVLVE